MNYPKSILGDARRYAYGECKKYRGCQQRMNKIEYLMEETEGNSDCLNIYGRELLKELVIRMQVDYDYGNLSQKAKTRWEQLNDRFENLNRCL